MDGNDDLLYRCRTCGLRSNIESSICPFCRQHTYWLDTFGSGPVNGTIQGGGTNAQPDCDAGK